MENPPISNPYIFILSLLWPFPTWHWPAVLPPPPREIMRDPDAVSCQVRDLMYLRSMPLWRARDTPQRAFYRLYEAFCAGDGPMMTYETQYFWAHESPGWSTDEIPDPECSDAEQYAVMASLAEVLTESFVWRLEIGLRRNGDILGPRVPLPAVIETRPWWTAKVPALEEELIINPDDVVYFESPFHARNITASTGDFYTV